MKFRRQFIFALIFCSCSSALAQTKQKTPNRYHDKALATVQASPQNQKRNLSSNAVGLLTGLLNVQFDYRVADKWMIGGRVGYARFSSQSATANGGIFGVVGTHYFEGLLTTGFNTAFSVEYLSLSGSRATVGGTRLAALLGYGLFWENGFNVNIAIGLQVINMDYTKLGLSNLTGTLPEFALNLGYAF